jgi:hypothetical protein
MGNWKLGFVVIGCVACGAPEAATKETSVASYEVVTQCSNSVQATVDLVSACFDYFDPAYRVSCFTPLMPGVPAAVIAYLAGMNYQPKKSYAMKAKTDWIVYSLRAEKDGESPLCAIDRWAFDMRTNCVMGLTPLKMYPDGDLDGELECLADASGLAQE